MKFASEEVEAINLFLLSKVAALIIKRRATSVNEKGAF
jgi:hypothetical protein